MSYYICDLDVRTLHPTLLLVLWYMSRLFAHRILEVQNQG
jgi:hypothetical protein